MKHNLLYYHVSFHLETKKQRLSAKINSADCDTLFVLLNYIYLYCYFNYFKIILDQNSTNTYTSYSLVCFLFQLLYL